MKILKYGQFDRLGVKPDGSDVVFQIGSANFRMPWRVAQMFVNNTGKAIAKARDNDRVFSQEIRNIKNA